MSRRAACEGREVEMAAEANTVTITFKTKLLKFVKIVLKVATTVVDPKDAVIKGIIELIERIIQAKAQTVELAVSKSFTGTAGTGSYSSVRDRVRMNLLDGDGRSHPFQIPSPKAADFLSDKEGADFGAGTPMAALVTSLTTYATAQDGSVGFTGAATGHRDERTRRPKR